MHTLTHHPSGEVVGKLCQHSGASVYKELEGILISGVRYNLERDQDTVKEHPDLLGKLGSDGRSFSPSVLNERVCICVCIRVSLL